MEKDIETRIKEQVIGGLTELIEGLRNIQINLFIET